jgi:hypothetical protein
MTVGRRASLSGERHLERKAREARKEGMTTFVFFAAFARLAF